MASESVHIALSNRNQDFLEKLLAEPVPFSDWIATVAFYKAVHVAEAVFACKEPAASQHSTDHSKRNHLLKTSYPQIWTYYSLLYRASRIARYLEFQGANHSTFSSFMSHGRVVSVLLETNLLGVEFESTPLISGAHPLKPFRPPEPLLAVTQASPLFALPPISARADPSPGKPPASP